MGLSLIFSNEYSGHPDEDAVGWALPLLPTRAHWSTGRWCIRVGTKDLCPPYEGVGLDLLGILLR
jgi:hypothetical protein